MSQSPVSKGAYLSIGYCAFAVVLNVALLIANPSFVAVVFTTLATVALLVVLETTEYRRNMDR